jgi:hypothetical protein
MPSFFLQTMRSPINMLYQELQVTYRDPLLQADTEYRSLIWRVLGRFADYTE